MSPESNDRPNSHQPGSSDFDATRYAWPTADLDPVVRMRVLAAGRPHAYLDEALFEIDFDSFWSYVTDFERNTPQIEGIVGAVRILSRVDEEQGQSGNTRITLETRPPLIGPWMQFQVVLRPGWCLMESSLGEIGMSARPEANGRTRFCHFEGSRRFGRLMRPFFAWNIRQDFRRLRRAFPDIGA